MRPEPRGQSLGAPREKGLVEVVVAGRRRKEGRERKRREGKGREGEAEKRREENRRGEERATKRRARGGGTTRSSRSSAAGPELGVRAVAIAIACTRAEGIVTAISVRALRSQDSRCVVREWSRTESRWRRMIA